MGEIERRLGRLEASAPAARDEEEVRAAACRLMSTEDLLTLREACRCLLDSGDDWGALTDEERDAFGLAWGRYEEAVREAAHGR